MWARDGGSSQKQEDENGGRVTEWALEAGSLGDILMV